MNERLVRRSVKIRVFAVVIVVPVRAPAGCSGAELTEFDDLGGICGVIRNARPVKWSGHGKELGAIGIREFRT
jgi:hypothetical protein